MKLTCIISFMFFAILCFSSVEASRKLEYLEKFDLRDMEVVSVEVEPCPWVQIGTPDGHFFFARQGSYMGKNYGKIINIQKDGITLKEFIEDGKGDWKERIVFIKVKKRCEVGEFCSEGVIRVQ